jgi:hypothetical protein
VQNFRTIGQGVFVVWVPENGMFPQESEVVLNTVLSANALHVIKLLSYFSINLLKASLSEIQNVQQFLSDSGNPKKPPKTTRHTEFSAKMPQ